MTVSISTTNKSALDQARPGQLEDILRQVKLGTMLTPLKRTFTGLTSAASFDLTLIDGTGETTGISNPNRLAALSVTNLRVTAGTALAGPRTVGDTGTTVTAPAGANGLPGVAKISDDGKTLTFDAAITAFVVTYIPRAGLDLTLINGALDGAP